MGVGVSNPEPIVAQRAVLEIEEARVADSPFEREHGGEQKQFPTVLRVLSGAGERDGETFSEWFSVPANGKISPRSKTGQVLAAALGPEARAETLEELAAKMVGRRFAAQIGASQNGQYSRVVHDTIGPASPEGEDGYGNSPAPDNGPNPGGGNDFDGSLF